MLNKASYYGGTSTKYNIDDSMCVCSYFLDLSD